ncbi:hypothetical protein HAX54_000774, partial [Datura stramonium]|nr:hypothetical protein [Datura stramonium]
NKIRRTCQMVRKESILEDKDGSRGNNWEVEHNSKGGRGGAIILGTHITTEVNKVNGGNSIIGYMIQGEKKQKLSDPKEENTREQQGKMEVAKGWK